MVGERIGQYLIIAKLGEGGMGAVWKALDERLGRPVALKFLTRAGDATHAARFAVEARAASALNHPGILTVHDIIEQNGTAGLVMEFVEGKTLAESIPRTGMPPLQVVRVGQEIADALGAAHRGGVIHRDLKPGNIMLRPDGRAKILDFGLARFFSEALSRDPSMSTQTLPPPVTGEGMVVGTAHYMSPEQADGKPVDPRSDIFSLGAVLYEMASGQRAFRGDTALAAVTAILRDDPAPLSGGPAPIPRELERIILRCVRKDPDRRFQTAIDVRNALEEVEEDLRAVPAVHTLPGPNPVRGRKILKSSMACLGILLLAAALFSIARPGRTTPESIVVRPLGTLPGMKLSASFSPDGNAIVFIGDGGQPGGRDVYVAMVDGGQPLRLTNTPETEVNPFYSPDGKRIYFTRLTAQGYLPLSMSALGGDERPLTSTPGLLQDISRDGRSSLLLRTSGEVNLFDIAVVDLSTGETRIVLPRPPHQRFLNGAFSPDSRWIYVTAGATDQSVKLIRVPFAGGTPQPAFHEVEERFTSVSGVGVSAAAILVAGRLKGTNTERVLVLKPDGTGPLDLPPGVPFGVPSRDGRKAVSIANFPVMSVYRARAFPKAGEAVTPELALLSNRYEASPQLSPDGRKFALSSRRSAGGGSSLWVWDAAFRQGGPVFSQPSYTTGSPVWSPDGQRIAFDARVNSAAGDIWIVPATGGDAIQLTKDPSEDIVPCFDPVGEWIYFTSNREGSHQIYRMPSAGGPAVRVSKQGGFTCQFSPDGKSLYYLKSRQNGGIWRLDLAAGTEQPVVPEMASRNWTVLHDGIYMLDAKQSSLSVNNGVSPGEALFYRFETGRVEKLGLTTTKPIGVQGIAVSSDRQWMYYSQADSEASDLVIVENVPVP